jgi:hypothetical protein
MTLENTTNYRILTPSDGMWLCNETDKIISDKVYLGVNADETMWKDITEEEKARLEELWNSEDFQDATEQDYQNALAEMGVDLNG